MTSERYLDDFQVGERFVTQTVTLDAQMIKSFAAQFDPQPQHLDEEHAARSFFGGLTASGWHTAALTIKLIVESELRISGGIVGSGLDEFQWYRPVRPGDSLHVEFEVVEIRLPFVRQNHGTLRIKIATLNQNGSPVLTVIANLLVPRRPAV
jgi:acyl dehydratase